MRFGKAIFSVLLGLCLISFMVGCGGGRSRLDIYGEGTLSPSDSTNVDGSKSDYRRFEATRDGYITVTMGSDDFDPYLIVRYGSEDGVIIAEDDDSGPLLDAYVTFWAEDGEVFYAQFTSSGAGAVYGNYWYEIYEGDYLKTKAPNDQPAKPKPAPDAKMPKK